jgi:hypothetical protein
MQNESGSSENNPFEGKFYYAGGDFIYEPKDEKDPAAILKAAQLAVTVKGGYDKLGRSNLNVTIPGRGEYHFDENTTVASLDAQDKLKQAREDVRGSLHGLTAEQLMQVAQYAKSLKG